LADVMADRTICRCHEGTSWPKTYLGQMRGRRTIGSGLEGSGDGVGEGDGEAGGDRVAVGVPCWAIGGLSCLAETHDAGARASTAAKATTRSVRLDT
jgi:hypothetical protein